MRKWKTVVVTAVGYAYGFCSGDPAKVETTGKTPERTRLSTLRVRSAMPRVRPRYISTLVEIRGSVASMDTIMRGETSRGRDWRPRRPEVANE